MKKIIIVALLLFSIQSFAIETVFTSYKACYIYADTVNKNNTEPTEFSLNSRILFNGNTILLTTDNTRQTYLRINAKQDNVYYCYGDIKVIVEEGLKYIDFIQDCKVLRIYLTHSTY